MTEEIIALRAEVKELRMEIARINRIIINNDIDVFEKRRQSLISYWKGAQQAPQNPTHTKF